MITARVIDRQGGDRTTSEGQSYGLFFALVANDRARFELCFPTCAKGEKSFLSTQTARVRAQFDPATNLYGKPPTYYDETLTLFGLDGNQHVFAFVRDGELQVTWSKQ
jgi:endo-1,4-beta-D-glucanase Y